VAGRHEVLSRPAVCILLAGRGAGSWVRPAGLWAWCRRGRAVCKEEGQGEDRVADIQIAGVVAIATPEWPGQKPGRKGERNKGGKPPASRVLAFLYAFDDGTRSFQEEGPFCAQS